MTTPGIDSALDVFHQAAARVPAYQALLREAGIAAGDIRSPADFARLPVLRKRDTFQRFGLPALCWDGELGPLSSVLTSSGHSGNFAFGLNSIEAGAEAAAWIDDQLDILFRVRERPTLLINCLPMGVKVPTKACTLAETSVRPDMAVALVRALGAQYSQIIFVGETAFLKRVLELGRSAGLDWPSYCVHLIVGEETLAENARIYLEGLLGIRPGHFDRGIIFSSMGVAEIGLNLFSEVPPVGPILQLRRALHLDRALRESLLGPRRWVPSFFIYDPRRLYVEFDDAGRLLVTTLDPRQRIPLLRYATGDVGALWRHDKKSAPNADKIPWEALEGLPLVVIEGRGEHALAGSTPVHPEAVKEGLYSSAECAAHTTANFRLRSGPERATLRVQLAPGIDPSPELTRRFHTALAEYIAAPFELTCEPYATFGDGMSLDYERKFAYLDL